MTVIFSARTGQCRFEGNENGNRDIEITVYMIRMLNNIMEICCPLMNKHTVFRDGKRLDVLGQI